MFARPAARVKGLCVLRGGEGHETTRPAKRSAGRVALRQRLYLRGRGGHMTLKATGCSSLTAINPSLVAWVTTARLAQSGHTRIGFSAGQRRSTHAYGV